MVDFAFAAGRILVALFLVFLNGFFVAAEFALVGLRRTSVDSLVREGRSGASLVREATENLDDYLAVCQLGIYYLLARTGVDRRTSRRRRRRSAARIGTPTERGPRRLRRNRVRYHHLPPRRLRRTGSVDVDGYRFRVEDVDGARVLSVVVRRVGSE